MLDSVCSRGVAVMCVGGTTFSCSDGVALSSSTLFGEPSPSTSSSTSTFLDLGSESSTTPTLFVFLVAVDHSPLQHFAQACATSSMPMVLRLLSASKISNSVFSTDFFGGGGSPCSGASRGEAHVGAKGGRMVCGYIQHAPAPSSTLHIDVRYHDLPPLRISYSIILPVQTLDI